MFSIFADSLFNPKGLVKYVNKRGFFIFLYLFVMAIFLSLGAFVSLIQDENSLITEATTGCKLESETIICNGDNYNIDNEFYIYGFRVYFLNDNTKVEDIVNMPETSIVVKDNSMKIFVGKTEVSSLNIFSSTYRIENLEDGIRTIRISILIASITMSILSNLLLIFVIVLFSSLTFLRFKNVIPYKKLFKLVVFAVTPVAVLLTLYNLIDFGQLVFFILMLISYRSIFILQRELFYQISIRKTGNDGTEDIVESNIFEDVTQLDDVEDDSDEKSDEE